jgi:2-formylbenzoate dehydrogenase
VVDTTSYVRGTVLLAGRIDEVLRRDWGLIIGNDRVAATDGASYPSIDPATEEVLAHAPDASPADVDRAVASSASAFTAWRRVAPLDRAAAVREIAGLLREHIDELSLLDALDGGNPVSATRHDVEVAACLLERFADWALMLRGETIPATSAGLHYTKQEPYGVVGRIIPFNHPVMFSAGKLGAPLVAGNTVVIKAPPQTPLSALRVGELCAQVLPPGVVNVLTSPSPAIGAAVARHPDVRRIALIGSEQAGRAAVQAGAEGGVKFVTLELGGKNAMVVRPDADLERAAHAAVEGMNFTRCQGQSCGSNSRLLIHRSVAEEVTERIVDLVQRIRIGLPVDPSTEMGPLVSAEQLARVNAYVDSACTEGARLRTGGGRPENLRRGFFLEPTVFSGVTPQMRVAREEIFGPVLSILTFDTDAEAIEIANSVPYGLTASVWTRDLDVAFWYIDGFDAGYTWVNDAGRHYPGLPFGGYKASGIGREEGLSELIEMTQTKSVSVRLAGSG